LATLHAWPEPSSIRLWRRRQRRRWLGFGALTFAAVPTSLYLLLLAGVDLFGTIQVAGMTVTRSPGGVAVLEDYAQRWKDAVVSIRVGPYIARYSRERLGARLPVKPVQTAVLGLGRSGNPLTDLLAVWTSRRSGLTLPWHAEVERAVLAARIRELRGRLERAPVPGVRLANGTELAGTPGLTISLVGAVDRIGRALASGAVQAQLDVLRVAAPGSVNYANGRYDARQFKELLAEFSTKYRTYGPAVGRARNIELAAQSIDGAVLEPGGELSFNQRVGQRSYERGYEAANELANRRVVRGVGGGVCQVAATLHAAAFFAGLALPVYQPHSRPARYIEVGLDTMVSWPHQDMRIANVYPFPVRVRAQANAGQLSIRLEGAGKPHPVEWSKEILQRIKPGVQRLTDAKLALGETKVLQEAIDGLVLRRRRTVYFPTGPKVEESLLRYPPNDRIVAVGGGSDDADTGLALSNRLPDLEDF